MALSYAIYILLSLCSSLLAAGKLHNISAANKVKWLIPLH
jgi:hypothetical protein